MTMADPRPDGRPQEERAQPRSPDVQETEEQGKRRVSPSAAVVYEAVRTEGEAELARPTSALAWSGIAAGLSMGFSLVAQGLLQSKLPDAAWTTLLVRAGYSVGFLIVILGRQQLFTENTLTPIIPYLAARVRGRADGVTIPNILRLWATVLAANLLGAFVFALVVARTGVFSEVVKGAFDRVATDAQAVGPGANFLRAIFAGWLIALMVWLLPVARGSRITVIVMITYLVGLADLTHVVAGAVEVFYLPFRTEARLVDGLVRYLAPALAGNVLGGVTLTTALNHAQVVSGARQEP
jgi:formate-nitrite transporter family protein